MVNLRGLALALMLCALLPACGSDKTTIVQGGSGELGNTDDFPATVTFQTVFNLNSNTTNNPSASSRIESRVDVWRDGSSGVRLRIQELGEDVFAGSITPGSSPGTVTINARNDNLAGAAGTIKGTVNTPATPGPSGRAPF